MKLLGAPKEYVFNFVIYTVMFLFIQIYILLDYESNQIDYKRVKNLKLIE